MRISFFSMNKVSAQHIIKTEGANDTEDDQDAISAIPRGDSMKTEAEPQNNFLERWLARQKISLFYNSIKTQI